MNVQVPGQGRVIGAYGTEAQTVIHMEECAELIQAISKMKRLSTPERDDTERAVIGEAAFGAYYNLVEEMADVLICMEQLKEIYGIFDNEIQKMIDEKCRRQEERINELT